MDEKDIIFECSTCHRQIGVLVWINDRYWLHKDGDDLEYSHARCSTCKKLWHWDSNEMRLKRLVQSRVTN